MVVLDRKSVSSSTSNDSFVPTLSASDEPEDDPLLDMDNFSIDMDSLMSDNFQMDFGDFSSQNDSPSGLSDMFSDDDNQFSADYDDLEELNESDRLLNELLENGDFDAGEV